MQLDSIRMGWNIYCMSFGGSSNPAIFTSGCRQDDSAARDWLLLGNLHQLATGMKVPLKRVCSLEILAFLKILTVRRALFHSTLDEWSDFREHLLTSFVPMKYWTTSTSWMLISVKESFLIPRKKWLQQKRMRCNTWLRRTFPKKPSPRNCKLHSCFANIHLGRNPFLNGKVAEACHPNVL